MQSNKNSKKKSCIARTKQSLIILVLLALFTSTLFYTKTQRIHAKTLHLAPILL